MSEKNMVGPVDADKVIETTTNRDTKTRWGTAGEKNFNEGSLAFLNNLLHLWSKGFVSFLKHFFVGDLNG